MTWQSIITDIQAAGYTQGQIASVVGCAQSSINDLLAGRTKDPRHSIGEALMQLHKKCANKQRHFKRRAIPA